MRSILNSLHYGLYLAAFAYLLSACSVNIKVARQTVATVKAQKESRHGNTWIYTYAVAGKTYSHEQKLYPGAMMWDKYRITYDSTNPEKNVLIDTTPVILPKEKISETVGVLTRLPEKHSKKAKTVMYNYYVNDVILSRGQRVPDSIDVSKLRMGAKYEVHFVTEQHGRAILYFDKPVSR